MWRLMLRTIARSMHRRLRRTAITFAGVALATASLVVLSSIMVAVGDCMIRNSVALDSGHVHVAYQDDDTVEPSQLNAIEQLPHVRAVLPRENRSGMLRHGDREAAVSIRGVKPQGERGESVVPHRIIEGNFLSSPGGLVIGRPLADALEVTLGDEVQVVPATDQPLSLKVEGIFLTNVESLDAATVWISLDDLDGEPDELAIFLDSSDAADAAADRIVALLGPQATVRTWQQALPELVGLISLNAVSMNVVLVLALLILAFGVSNTAFMSVNERTREMGILKALGVRPSAIGATVLAETLLMVTLAGITGLALGAAAARLWATVGFDLGHWTSANRHFLLSGVIYPRVTAYALFLPGAVAIGCGLLAGLVPAWRAARVNVVQALRWL